ncbi:hypothetical protein HNP82_003311 [Catenibacillus scindens]|uniref:GyrI-like small molecule binding domain-containing protein n=2 Tax=Catenibacillus scindens TaxID=673271 RepID=A0A7W8M6N6_9FIRM|nr:GyrI-like domain-containing protein [Catenibacillus scindens]MBB5266154.1 hypothetical protein [Catenibacillus scindens]
MMNSGRHSHIHRFKQDFDPAFIVLEVSDDIMVENVDKQCILVQKVNAPYSLEQVSIATKECFVRSFKEQLPVFFQSGAIVPYSRIRQQRYTEASFAFLPIDIMSNIDGTMELPEGQCVCTYHTGDYYSIGCSYERLLAYCSDNKLDIISDSFEFAVNDYLSTKDENEYITKIMFYVKKAQEINQIPIEICFSLFIIRIRRERLSIFHTILKMLWKSC